ncbi:amidase [Paenibacillus bovis]|uniref:Amidase n=1 Tax=Paenibacillus bovis TaxID=1616788 RepID=A0A172ZCQ9_9BACL|nr:amidase [Paenibacillus bovis]ANF95398.1 amidase [Paenibacillus bovis]
MTSEWNAFVNEQFTLTRNQNDKGLLSGLTFGVKDVFALEGYTSGAGNPDWLRTHEPSSDTAPAILNLLHAGAVLKGTTHTDELMYSLNGQNSHYGTPVNPRAADRIPGGSSSGSAVAVAAGLRDFALGTDTGGSVRIPSSYCGIYGMRPTHNAVSLEGVIPLAAGFDTVGWMAKTAGLLHDVGQVLLAADPMQTSPDNGHFARVYWPREAWDIAEENTRKLLLAAAQELLSGLPGHSSSGEWISIAPEGLGTWMTAFRSVQGIQIWEQHREWIELVQPVFAPDIAERFAWASTLKREEQSEAFTRMNTVRDSLRTLLGTDGLMILPTATGPAPSLHIQGEDSERRRSQTMQLSSIAGLAGLPQITIPAGEVDGAPVGLSVIAGAHQDLRLLQWVRQSAIITS